MTARELASTAGALALAGLIAVGVDEVLDAQALEAKAVEVDRALEAKVVASADAVEVYESRMVRYDGGTAFVARGVDKGEDVLVVLEQTPCVIPDCSMPDGGWDDQHAPVDCLFQYPGEPQRWRGCNVGARVYSSGAACLPAACLEGP